MLSYERTLKTQKELKEFFLKFKSDIIKMEMLGLNINFILKDIKNTKLKNLTFSDYQYIEDFNKGIF